MSWLLWREYRRNRWILAAGAAGVLLPIIIAVVFDLNRSSGFIGAFFLSCVFSQMTVALLAGNAVAGERSDRSAEFIACAPERASARHRCTQRGLWAVFFGVSSRSLSGSGHT